MTDEQKDIVLGSKKKNVVCLAECAGGLWAGLVNVKQGAGVSLTVCRTRYEFEDADEAVSEAEIIVDRLRNNEDIHSQIILNDEPEEVDEPDDSDVNPDGNDDNGKPEGDNEPEK